MFYSQDSFVELSAFLVIAFYAYRNRGTLRFSALLYTIAAESTVYFLAMVAAQVYIQLSFNLTKVRSLQVPAPLRDGHIRSQGPPFSVL